MKNTPVYFPMTYLAPAVENTLAACFGQTAVYRPSDRKLPEAMQAGVDAGRLVVHIPVAKQSARLAELLKAYHHWAKENEGVDLAFFKSPENRLPFFGNTSISRIRQDIRDQGNTGREEAPPDPVFEARLFLEMAQELDRRDGELARSLDDVRARESSMLAELTGGAADHADIGDVIPGSGVTDPGAYMTGTRLQKWWRLVRSGTLPGNILVTDSRAVVEHLVEIRPGLENMAGPIRLPQRLPGDRQPAAWQGRLLEYLDRLTKKRKAGPVPTDLPAAKPNEAAVSLVIYRHPLTNTASFFDNLDAPADVLPADVTDENLLICLVADEGGGC